MRLPVLDRLILSAQRPSRYAGGELNAVRKDLAAARVKWALAFPDTYEVGMSNVGFVRDLSFTSDGWWTLFVKPSGDSVGGDVYMVASGSDDNRKVLSATPETAFVGPIARPRVGR